MSIIDIPPVFKMIKQNKCSAFCHIHILSIIDNFNSVTINSIQFMEVNMEAFINFLLFIFLVPLAVIAFVALVLIAVSAVDIMCFAISSFYNRFVNHRSKED